MKEKTRILYLITGFLCVCLIFVSISPLFGYDNYLLMLGLCVILVSIAIVLYIPVRIEISRQYLKEKTNNLSLKKLKEGNSYKLSKKSKKIFVIGIILIIIPISIYGVLQINNIIEKQKFHGTWRAMNNNASFTIIMFWSSNTITIWDFQSGIEDICYITEYSISYGQLIIDAEGSHPKRIFNYKFNDDNTLILTDSSTGLNEIYCKDETINMN